LALWWLRGGACAGRYPVGGIITTTAGVLSSRGQCCAHLLMLLRLGCHSHHNPSDYTGSIGSPSAVLCVGRGVEAGDDGGGGSLLADYAEEDVNR
jgi:hypothetical protein